MHICAQPHVLCPAQPVLEQLDQRSRTANRPRMLNDRSPSLGGRGDLLLLRSAKNTMCCTRVVRVTRVREHVYVGAGRLNKSPLAPGPSAPRVRGSGSMTPMPAVTRDEMNEIIPALRGVYGHHFAEYLYGLYTAAMKVE